MRRMHIFIQTSVLVRSVQEGLTILTGDFFKKYKGIENAILNTVLLICPFKFFKMFL